MDALSIRTVVAALRSAHETSIMARLSRASRRLRSISRRVSPRCVWAMDANI